MNIKTDLKGFYVGDREGIAIYVGSTQIWPTSDCNPQIVTVATPVPQGTTTVDPCSFVFNKYDGTKNDIQRDWMGRGSGTESTVTSFTADLSELPINIDGVSLCNIYKSGTIGDVKLNSGDLSYKGNYFTTSHFDLNNQEITNLNSIYGVWRTDNQFVTQRKTNITLSNVKIPDSPKEVNANYLMLAVYISDYSVLNNFKNLILVDPIYAFAKSGESLVNFDSVTIDLHFKGNCSHMFDEDYDLTSVPNNFIYEDITNISYMFDGCTDLTSIPDIDCSLVTDCTSFANNCQNLVSVGRLDGLGENLTNGGILYFAKSPNLSEESLQNIADSIGTAVAKYTSISLNASVYDRLTEEQKSLIASKNWSINRVV